MYIKLEKQFLFEVKNTMKTKFKTVLSVPFLFVISAQFR